MFPGSPRRRDWVRVIPLGAVSQIALCGDDPDFIVLEVFDLAFSGMKIKLPNDAQVGKVFKFALTTHVKFDPPLTSQYVDIAIPTSNNIWRLYSGQRPVFTRGPNGWITDAGSYFSGFTTNGDLAIGSDANAGSSGTAFGYNTSAYSRGAAFGWGSQGYNNGAAFGYASNARSYGAAFGGAANGSTNGVAVGYAANGSTNGVAIGYGTTATTYGTAIGYSASTNGKEIAVALGYFSKAQRYGEFVKSADGVAICKQSFSILDWYGDTTNATQTEIFLGAVNQRALVLASSAYMFKLLAVARDNVSNTCSIWEITGGIKRDAANNTAIIGLVTSDLVAQDVAAAAWDIAVSADDTNGALAIKVTGAAATTIRWNVRGDISELRF